MEIKITTGNYDHSTPMVVRVPVQRRVFVQEYEAVVVAAAGYTEWDFQDKIPDGYVCVTYERAALKACDNGACDFEAIAGGIVRACCRSGGKKARGQIGTGADAQYYYDIEAALICVRSDLVPEEETP